MVTEPTSGGAFGTALVAALTDLGLRHVCLSPGARHGPLSLAFASSDITVWTHHDERSSGFFALGLARATHNPVAVLSTSGTAAAELFPAIVEARMSRVPLLVLTADRPPELRGVGAPQTIDQVKMFGDAVVWFHDAGVPGQGAATFAPHLAAHAWAIAGDEPPGPVHLNFPFEEPLLSSADTAATGPVSRPARTLGGPLLPGESELAEAAALLTGRKLLVVAGAVEDPSFPGAVSDLSVRSRNPVHADPLSGLRNGTHDRSSVIVGSDLLASAGMLEKAAPEAVLRFGAIPTSKPVWTWLAAHPEIPQVIVEPAGWRDPTASARVVLRGHPSVTADRLAKILAPSQEGWLDRWRDASTIAQSVIEEVLSAEPQLTEPAVARIVSMKARGVFGVASSMPIRDVDGFGVMSDRPVRHYGNRGANGIDGTISMTLGAVASSGDPGLLLIGDVAALHDLTALRTAAGFGLPLTTVIVHNDGGGIFHFLPQSQIVPEVAFEKVFGAPHGTDFVAVAEAMGVPAVRITDRGELEAALEEETRGPRVIEIPTDRRDNATLHARVVEAIREAL